ncbi:MAG: sulfotransferase family protein [Candidatus Binatia bacterium]
MPDDIRITDLATPQLTDAQRAAIAYAAAQPPVEFREAAVLAAAQQQTGLSDFGADDFRARLRVWLQAVDEDDRLGPLGRLGLFGNCVRFLSNRLRLEDLLRRRPEILAVPITRPIIVAGLPRSGTTHLLNLLAADARLRSLPYWEALEPVPAAGEGPGRDGRDPRYLRCLRMYEGIAARLPLLRAMHDMPPEHIHEEVELLDLDFASYQLEWVCLAPRWRDYYLGLDLRPHYAYMKKALQALQWLRGPQRWVLKSPQHLEQLGPLIDTFPDATVVLTHRDPVAVIRSAITMMAYGERLRRTRIDLTALAAYWIDRVERLLRACVRDRDRLPAAQSADVLFHEFMADDLGALEAIYRRAELPLTDAARSAMTAFLDDNRRGKHGRVVYDLQADFGLDPAAIRRRFAFYFDRFPVRAE